ncbi:MAG: sigma-70 family RNA polymerase sigma factor [Hasllibacter sp.]
MAHDDGQAARDRDGALMAAFAAGDARAAAVLTAELTPLAYRHAARLLGSAAEAEDVAQEAMVRLWRIAPDWDAGRTRASTWLYRVVANLCTDRLRRRGRTRPLEAAGDPPDPSPGAERGLIDAARRDALRDALATLPERQREAVVLRHVEGLPNPEIAAIMDTGVSGVESLIARGKAALREALGPRAAELGWME